MAIQYSDPSRENVSQLMDDVADALEVELESEEIEEMNLSPRKRFFERFDYSWSPTEKAYLTVIKAAADEMVASILTGPILALNDLYAQARVVKLTGSGRPMKDLDGNPVWETDELGRPIEDWSSVTNENIEQTIIKFYTIKLDVTNRVSDLYLEAVFARYMLKDGWNERYSNIIEGTVNEKTAAADRAVRREKYKAFSRYWLWFKANELQKDINATVYNLEKIRSNRNWSK